MCKCICDKIYTYTYSVHIDACILHNVVRNAVTYFHANKAHRVPYCSSMHYALCFLFVCRPLGFLSCHTRLLHNHGAIPLEKGLERTGNNRSFSVHLYTVQMLDVPHTIKETYRMCPKCFRHERKWQRHLPSMLIKFEQFSILCCCLGDFFLD